MGEIKDFMYSTHFRVNKSLSLVVCLRDVFRPDRALQGSVQVYLKESFKGPQKNLSGNYVFTELEEGQYTLCVDSQYYFHYCQPVSIKKSKYSLVNIRLNPNIQYPFQRSDTLLRGTISDSLNQGIANAGIRAVVLKNPIARIAQMVQAGDRTLSVVNSWGDIEDEDAFIIGEEPQAEYCTLSKADSVSPFKQYRTDKEFEYEHRQGTGVFYTVSTFTGNNGELVVYFRNAPAKKFSIRLEVSESQRVWGKEIELFEGKTSSVGILKEGKECTQRRL
ncbi:MAG: carboxypeptidase-like regulatory domain-containing protein [Clostridia bacterium]|nr:carboxypeptidase-like regulatory domain-containing protein [Clostridia bacterium]